MTDTTKYEKATFAGGCFWCMVEPFDELPGIIDVISGYTGGFTDNPTYEEVCSNQTGHVEAVQITFDPKLMPYKRLLDLYWRQIDPTDAFGQFADRGSSYQTAIFYHNDDQKQKALESRKQLEESGKFDRPIVTEIKPAMPFYKAEDKHQHYYKTNSFHYKMYKKGSGREAFINNKWKKPVNKDNLQERLSPIQYEVTQNNKTEPAFNNEFWDHEEEGIYVDIVSGEPLFSSTDKYDAGCGWPSFTRPINKNQIQGVLDTTHGMIRTEVRSSDGDSHLGHVFEDGPDPTGLRFCINSASLRFIPKDKLDEEGYGEYLYLFQ